MHKFQIISFGGSHGIRDMGLLESALYAPQASFDEQFLYKDIFEMGAAYIYGLIKNHPFVDGNKRIGVIAGIVFLQRNDIQLSIDNETLHLLGVGVADSTISESAIVDILKRHALRND